MEQPPLAYRIEPRRSPVPTWFRVFVVGSAACMPGGFVFLLALVTSAHVNFPIPVWLALAVAGGVGGHFALKAAWRD